MCVPACTGVRLRQQGIVCKSYAGVRETYAERTWAYAVRSIDSHDFSDGLFLAGFSEALTVSSRISSFPQILGLSKSRRQSPGWHSLDGNVPIWAVRGCPLVVRLAHPGWNHFHLVAGSSTPSQALQELLCSAAPPSCWTMWFTLRALLLLRGLGADALGHTGSLLGYSVQGVLFPEGSQAKVKELLKACLF